jgi:hypothetical protein
MWQLQQEASLPLALKSHQAQQDSSLLLLLLSDKAEQQQQQQQQQLLASRLLRMMRTCLVTTSALLPMLSYGRATSLKQLCHLYGRMLPLLLGRHLAA